MAIYTIAVGFIFLLKGAFLVSLQVDALRNGLEILSVGIALYTCFLISKRATGITFIDFLSIPAPVAVFICLSMFATYLLLDLGINGYIQHPDHSLRQIVGIGLSAFMTSLFEEISFRGFVFILLIKNGFKLWPSILMSSILFSLVHFNYDYQTQWPIHIAIFCIGISLSLQFAATGSLILPVLFHFLNNLFASLFETSTQHLPYGMLSNLNQIIPPIVLACFSLIFFSSRNKWNLSNSLPELFRNI